MDSGCEGGSLSRRCAPLNSRSWFSQLTIIDAPSPPAVPLWGAGEGVDKLMITVGNPVGGTLPAYRKRLMWFLAIMILLAAVTQAAEPLSTYRLVLGGPSVVEAMEQARTSGQSGTIGGRTRIGRDYKAAVIAEQAALENELSSHGLEVVSRTTVLLNSVTVRASSSRFEELKRLPGIRSVRPVRVFSRAQATSVPFVGAPPVWGSGEGITGNGVRIGIIDSGIDYTHADFGGSGDPNDYSNNDPTQVEAGSFPTDKVIGGTDLAGDDYDASGVDGSATPSPDDDPLDPPGGDGHGTHLAGIAAGIGVLADGSTFAGTYDQDTYANNQFSIGPGVAPAALLYAVKIFGKKGTTALVPEGLDWAADPNGDGDTGDHLDVVTLSLGTAFGAQDSTDPEAVAISRLVGLGCVVAVAAGNSGNTAYVVAGPGASPEAITVANTYDDGVSFSSVHVTSPPSVAGDYISVESLFTPSFSSVGPITAGIVYPQPNTGCSAITNPSAVQGKIALLDRGVCAFSDEVRNAQHAGAIGVIVVNNHPGDPIPMPGDGDTSDITIPAVMISMTDGALLKSQLNQTVTATLTAPSPGLHPELADLINDRSSRGPALYDSQLKPDISAPGTAIASARAGSGSGGVTFSGTSIAAAQVAGGAALLRQEHPDWTTYDIKVAMMTTATPSHDSAGHLYPESRSGAGRLALGDASQLRVLVHNAESTTNVSLSFGSFELTAPTNLVQAIRIENRDNQATFSVVVSNTLAQPGISVAAETNTVTLPATATTDLNILVAIDPSQFRPQLDPTSPTKIGALPRQQMVEASGEIYLTSDRTTVHLPWHVIARALSRDRLAAATIGVPLGDSVTFPVPTTGPSMHPHPLVSVFDFGAFGTNQQENFPQSAGDLLAVGAASDLSVASSFDEARVFFGLVVAGKWTTPQRALQHLDIEIDLNNDGQPDYTIVNTSLYNVLANDLENPELASDAMLSASYIGASADSVRVTGVVAGSSLNVLDPSLRDTAPFHNAAMIHGVLAKDIGLSPAQTQFRYRASITAPGSLAAGGVPEVTSWISYDIAKPQIDPTPYGLQFSPFFDEGRGVELQVNRTNVAEGKTNAFALVVHQHNPPGSQIELLQLRLDTDDADANGLTDAWELTYFGHLGNSAQDDPDHDGATNAQELAAGTNPLDPQSVFKIVSVNPAPSGSRVTVQWVSEASRRYDLERSDNLLTGFAIVVTNVAGANGFKSATDVDSPARGPVFYRVRIH